jgi:hypothetical protein
MRATKSIRSQVEIPRPCRLPEGAVSRADLRRRVAGLERGVARLLLAVKTQPAAISAA